MDKELTDLLPDDLRKYPVWVFPMDGTVSDVTVKPVLAEDSIGNHLIIVRTLFRDSKGRDFIGYVFWGEPHDVEILKPVVFLDDQGDKGLSFWTGLIEPSGRNFEGAAGVLDQDSFPIHFKSDEVFGLEPIEGELEGIC
jgi:hypothetical protein